MRKAISLFLAASVLCLATSAMAAPSVSSVTGDRNGVNSLPTSSSAAMSCFVPGGTINFDVSGVTSERELTVISYKDGSEGSLSDSNVQYINQYTLTDTLTDTSKHISYTIRDLPYGRYVLKINDSSGTVATFYYKVGDAEVVLLTDELGGYVDGDYGTPYLTGLADDGTYSIGFLGRVTIGSSEISLADLGAHPGFLIKEGSGTAKRYGFGLDTRSSNGDTDAGSNNLAKTIANLDAMEITSDSSYSFIYGLTMYNVTSGRQNNITAQAVLDADK